MTVESTPTPGEMSGEVLGGRGFGEQGGPPTHDGETIPTPGMVKRLVRFFDVRTLEPAERLRLACNLLVGLVVVLVLGSLIQTRWGDRNLNLVLDQFVAWGASRVARSPAPSDRVCFIDIDDDTWRAWGEPLVTPRDRLARLVRAVAAGSASVVLFDVLFEHPDPVPGNDQAFREAISDLVAVGGPTRVVFPVRIGSRGERKRHQLDDLIDAHPDRLFRGIPYLSATPDDRVVRHWRLYGRARVENASRPAVLWGTPFLGAILAANRHAALPVLERAVERARQRADASGFHRIELSADRALLLGFRPTDFFLQRIRFSLIPRQVLAEVRDGNLRPFSYDEVAGLASDPVLAGAFFANRVVIIGNSAPDCGDLHQTPLGIMPGMYIMGNSVHTILSGIQPSPSDPWFDLLLELLAITIGAIIQVRIPSKVGRILTAIVIYLGFGTLSFVYFMWHGVFLNFVFALVAMDVITVVAKLESLIRGSLDLPPTSSGQREPDPLGVADAMPSGSASAAARAASEAGGGGHDASGRPAGLAPVAVPPGAPGGPPSPDGDAAI